MNLRRTCTFVHFLCFFCTLLLLNLACSKDSDTLEASATNEEVAPLVEQEAAVEEEIEEEEETEDIKEEGEDNRKTSIECGVGGGKANETGEKIWCWNDIVLPDYSGRTGVTFSNGELNFNNECYEKQVTKDGDRLKFTLTPRTPETASWCSRDFNMRAEISAAPWNVKNPIGTEEWKGWSYTFGDNYIIDQKTPWLFYQVHHGVGGDSPQVEFMIAMDGQYGAEAGEIIIKNTANNGEDFLTGIVPTAGQTLDIVTHVIWGDGSNGLLQVWFDGVKVYDKQVRTVYQHAPWGGNSKWGIYKWRWANEEGVMNSEEQGITSMESYIGPIRSILRQPGGADYGKDSYTRVAPR